jgi:hypothetical protein
MDGGVHFLQTSTAHDVLSVKSSYLQTTDPIPDFMAAQDLYVQVLIFTGSAQTDKQHVHKLY